MRPAPGSKRARELGCTCDALPKDSELRRALEAVDPDRWWVAVGCPLHDVEDEEDHEDER